MSTRPRRIVAAVDGSVTSRIALRRAAEEAIAHSASLEVLLAWSLLDQALLIGSVSSQVVHHAPCPVLVVRGPDRPSSVDLH
jgi:nucleotide-binding universal stress UspA family protein